jgi:hypothetical protein
VWPTSRTRSVPSASAARPRAESKHLDAVVQELQHAERPSMSSMPIRGHGGRRDGRSPKGLLHYEEYTSASGDP